MRVGARVWKTGLAVTLAIAASMILGLDKPVFAGIAAIICMQPTIAGSVRKGIERMQATIIGAIFSLLALIAIDQYPILHAIHPMMIGLTVLVVMAVTIRLGWMDSLVLAAATVVVVMILPPDENMYAYAISRTVVTLIGVIVATGVNATFITPQYSEPLTQSLSKLIVFTGDAYRHAVTAFARCEREAVEHARESLVQGEELLETVATTIQRIEEEANLRKRIYRLQEDEVESLRRIVETLTSIKQSTETIIGVTSDILGKTPNLSESRPRACEFLWNLVQPSLRTLDEINTFLESGKSLPRVDDSCGNLHEAFEGEVREWIGEEVSLIEVSVLAFEVNRVTANLAQPQFRQALSRLTARNPGKP